MSGLLTYGSLSDQQLERILEHKYKSTGISAVEPLLQPFWNALVPFIPKGIAPNSLTFCGLLACVLTVLPLLYYSPTLSSEIPSLFSVLFVIGVFIYQTLDALDGKHARKINACSPLGEFLDHGCDSISMYILALGCGGIISLGDYYVAMFIQFFILNCVFYTSQWQAYVTGTIYFESFSVTEGLVCCMLFSLISAIFGVNLWKYQDPILGFQLNLIQFLVVVIGATVLFYRFTGTISVGGTGKFGTTVANTSVLFPICPLFLVLGSATLVVIWSPSAVLQTDPLPFYLGFGAVMARISQNIVIAGMTKGPISLFDPVMLGPFSLLLNLYFDCLIDERFLLWVSCIWTSVFMAYFYCRSVVQMADFLGVYVFSNSERPTVSNSTSTTVRRPLTPSSSLKPNVPSAPSHNYKLRRHVR